MTPEHDDIAPGQDFESIEADETDLSNYPQHRKTGLYIMLFCGLLLTMIGLYLTLTNTFAFGPSDGYGQEAGGIAIVSGPYSIIVGLGFSVFPSYHLIKQYLKTKGNRTQ